MARCVEYKCGCIVHDIAGAIRFCPGLRSKSLSGKVVNSAEGADSRHQEAMASSPVHVYQVADIRP